MFLSYDEQNEFINSVKGVTLLEEITKKIEELYSESELIEVSFNVRYVDQDDGGVLNATHSLYYKKEIN